MNRLSATRTGLIDAAEGAEQLDDVISRVRSVAQQLVMPAPTQNALRSSGLRLVTEGIGPARAYNNLFVDPGTACIIDGCVEAGGRVRECPPQPVRALRPVLLVRGFR